MLLKTWPNSLGPPVIYTSVLQYNIQYNTMFTAVVKLLVAGRDSQCDQYTSSSYRYCYHCGRCIASRNVDTRGRRRRTRFLNGTEVTVLELTGGNKGHPFATIRESQQHVAGSAGHGIPVTHGNGEFVS